MEKQPLPVLTWTDNPFTLFNDRWVLISAHKDGKTNAMTASWGGLGILWNKRVATVYIRPTRYTLEFLDGAESFSLSVFDASYKPMLMDVMGRQCGRTVDKLALSGLTETILEGVPAYEQAELTLLVRKLYRQPMEASRFLDDQVRAANYPLEDYHIMFIGEITSVYK